jgi:hypothetical protein
MSGENLFGKVEDVNLVILEKYRISTGNHFEEEGF